MNLPCGTHRRRLRNTPSSLSRARKRGTPATPFMPWKNFIVNQGGQKSTNMHHQARAFIAGGGAEAGSGGRYVDVSARKLAAGLWRLRLAAGGGKCLSLKCESSSCDGLGIEPGVGHGKTMFPSRRTIVEYSSGKEDMSRNPESFSSLKRSTVYKVKSSLLCPKHTIEVATNWDPSCSRISKEIYCFYGRMKPFDNQVDTVSAASVMQAELVQAQVRINELEAKCRLSKKKLENLQRKFGEETASWQRREHLKVRAVVDDLKNELLKEKKNCQRMAIINSKLVNELANAKSSAKQFRHNCEEEKKTRELMEELCTALSCRIAEDKAEVEALKKEAAKVQEEVEEERKMLQMAEVWREECVRIKLVDAKLALEDRYCQMNRLIADLETFLRSERTTLDVMELRKAELIREAAKSVKVKDIKEFTYTPPKSGDVYSIIEELKHIGADERVIEPCHKHSPASDVSKVYADSSLVNDYNNWHLLNHSNGFSDNNCHLKEDITGSETASHEEDRCSTYSFEESGLSFSRFSQGQNAWQSARECNQNAARDSPNTQISEICSLSEKQSRKKVSFVASFGNLDQVMAGFHKQTPDVYHGRLLNGTISSVRMSSPGMKFSRC